MNQNHEDLIDKRYRKIQKLGEGGYGRVTKCSLVAEENDPNKQNKFYAVKKYFLQRILKFNNDIEPHTEKFVEQQFQMIQSLQHPNIIKALEHFEAEKNEYIVYEYFPTDLARVIKKAELKIPRIKSFCKQIFTCLSYLHENSIIHRDIKPENFLIDEQNETLILCDFDLAKKFENMQEKKCKNVCTVYYKPPEVLVGSQYYNESIDVWGAGCVIAEMLLGKPLFECRNEIGVLNKIFELLGSPNEQNWPSYKEIPDCLFFTGEEIGCGIKTIFERNNCDVPESLLDLLEKIFVYESSNRISAKDALNHSFLKD